MSDGTYLIRSLCSACECGSSTSEVRRKGTSCVIRCLGCRDTVIVSDQNLFRADG